MSVSLKVLDPYFEGFGLIPCSDESVLLFECVLVSSSQMCPHRVLVEQNLGSGFGWGQRHDVGIA